SLWTFYFLKMRNFILQRANILSKFFQYGYIHQCVGLHIAGKYGASNEVWLKDGDGNTAGRADILKNDKVWEIKHYKAGVNRMAEATVQAMRYVGLYSKRDGSMITGLGAAHAFKGTFIVNYLNYSYSVYYETPKEGVVLYTVTEIPYRTSADFVFEPKKQKAQEVNNVGITASTVAIPIMFVGGSSPLTSAIGGFYYSGDAAWYVQAK
ncbi:MAG: hypothetical protein ACI4V3_03475, partial [Faecousia sp.]